MAIWTIGIDPGIHGAIAALDHNCQVLKLMRTPITPVVTSGKTRHKLNIPLAVIFFQDMMALAEEKDARLAVYLEQVAAMITDSGVSGFSLGRNLGQWEGVIGALGLPLTTVPPVVWKRQMITKTVKMPKIKEELTKKEKGRLKAQVAATRKKLAIEVANNMFPQCAEAISTQKDDGPAEALLLAKWGHLKEHGLLQKIKNKDVESIEVPRPARLLEQKIEETIEEGE